MGAEPINPVGAAGPLSRLTSAATAQKGVADEFKQVFRHYLGEVSDLQQRADKAVRDLATGQMGSVHELILAVNEADMSFRLMMQMRNKLIDAYKEIMRMQV